MSWGIVKGRNGWRLVAIVALVVALGGCDKVKSLVSGSDKTPLPGTRAA